MAPDFGLPGLKGCVFIVTYGRSGSTVLQRIVNTIPGMRLRGENMNALEMLFRSHRRIRDGREKFGADSEDELHPWHGIGGTDPDAYGRALIETFVAQVLRPDSDARWIGFKEIRYNKLGGDFGPYLDFMRTFFPGARFLFNTRAVEDVAVSAWWRDRDPQEVRRLIRGSDRRFAAYAEANPEVSFLTRYEDFTRDPDALRPFFDMLGEPMDRDRVEAILAERLTH